MSTKVVVAMSGGVDSSVAAALLKEQGYEVIGLTFKLFSNARENAAAEVAQKLGIAHCILDLRKEFQQYIINDFINEYKYGRTPNPCVRCNPYIKFHYLLDRARYLKAEYVATGHYARIVSNKLLKGKDKRKDQAYMLYRLDQEKLAHTLFPLGEMTKEEAKKKAEEMGLPVEEGESQDVCFVENDDYGRFLKETCPEAVKPGPIVDQQGKVVGRHDGIAFYTLGQRKGIGHHSGQPKYVIKLDREKNSVVIGDKEDTLGKELLAEQVSYISGVTPQGPLKIMAKIRYNSPEAKAIVTDLGDDEGKGRKVRVVFEESQNAITPGQSVVFYQGDEVLGGGIIS